MGAGGLSSGCGDYRDKKEDPTMANIFAKTAAKKDTVAPKKSRKETVWRVGQDQNQAKLAEAVGKVNFYHAEAKKAESAASVYKSILKNAAEENYLRDFATSGIPPETPMKFVNDNGESCTFVVQDRTGVVKPEVRAALEDVLGEDAVTNIVTERIVFSFDPVIMDSECAGDNNRKVQDVLGERLGALLSELTSEGLISAEQAESLLTAKQECHFRPNILDRMADICGKSVPTMRGFISAIGSGITQYIKAG